MGMGRTNPPARRHVGLSNKQQPRPLLSMVQNRSTHQPKAGSGDDRSPAPTKMKEARPITAPPESSDEEEYDKKRYEDIKPTIFTKAESSASPLNNSQRSVKDDSKSSSQEMSTRETRRGGGPSSSAGSKRSAEDPFPEMGGHLKTAHGFTKKSKISNARQATYGGKPSQSRVSQHKPSKSSAPRSAASTSIKKLQGSTASLNSGRALTPLSKPFIKGEISSPEETKPSKTFINKATLLSSSPQSVRGSFRSKNLLVDESPKKGKFRLLELDDDSDAVAKKPVKDSQQLKKSKRFGKSRAKKQKESPEPVSEEASQKPAFKLATLDDLDFSDGGNNDFAASFESVISDDEASDISLESSAVTAKCPMCHEVVDAQLLAKHSDHGRMNIKKQAAFCRLHKRQTALSSRSQNGYPKIDWGTIGRRFDKHQNFLREILEGTRQSHYTNSLKENIESGKNRTVLKTDDSLTPGYYGPRGLRAMTEYILRTLSPVIRKRAIEDRLVSARGYTGYVQAVLVPELTVRLIMEDMDVDKDDAREIMQDSIEVGELLHEDVGDIIAGVSDEEDI